MVLLPDEKLSVSLLQSLTSISITCVSVSRLGDTPSKSPLEFFSSNETYTNLSSISPIPTPSILPYPISFSVSPSSPSISHLQISYSLNTPLTFPRVPPPNPPPNRCPSPYLPRPILDPSPLPTSSKSVSSSNRPIGLLVGIFTVNASLSLGVIASEP